MQFSAQSTDQKRIMLRENIRRAKQLIKEAEKTKETWEAYVVEQKQRLADLESRVDESAHDAVGGLA